jgi:hypothetical protein
LLSSTADAKAAPEGAGTSFAYLGFCNAWGKSRRERELCGLPDGKEA